MFAKQIWAVHNLAEISPFHKRIVIAAVVHRTLDPNELLGELFQFFPKGCDPIWSVRDPMLKRGRVNEVGKSSRNNAKRRKLYSSLNPMPLDDRMKILFPLFQAKNSACKDSRKTKTSDKYWSVEFKNEDTELRRMYFVNFSCKQNVEILEKFTEMVNDLPLVNEGIISIESKENYLTTLEFAKAFGPFMEDRRIYEKVLIIKKQLSGALCRRLSKMMDEEEICDFIIRVFTDEEDQSFEEML